MKSISLTLVAGAADPGMMGAGMVPAQALAQTQAPPTDPDYAQQQQDYQRQQQHYQDAKSAYDAQKDVYYERRDNC